MSYFFENCSNIYSIDLSNFNTSKVNNMKWMFNKCHKIKEIKGLTKFNTNQITNMKGMFNECNELEYLDLSNFKASKVNNKDGMLNNFHNNPYQFIRSQLDLNNQKYPYDNKILRKTMYNYLNNIQNLNNPLATQ